MTDHEDKISFLVSAGIERNVAKEAILYYNGDAQVAMNRIFDGVFKAGMGGGSTATPAGTNPATTQQGGSGTGSAGSGSRALVPVGTQTGGAGTGPASTGGTSTSGATNTPGGTTSQQAIDQAIRASLQDKQEREKSPLELQRLDPTLPLGLRNIGNTCFVNCLLQIYFHIQVFRNNLLSMDLPEEILPSAIFDQAQAPRDPRDTDGGENIPLPSGSGGDEVEVEGEGELPPRRLPEENLPEGVSPDVHPVESRKNRLLTLKELQKCFAFLALSDKKYYDPSVLLADFKLTGVVHQVGIQEDITEASDRFMKFLEKTSVGKVVQEMFYGKSVTEYRFNQSEEDTSRSGLVQREDKFAAMHAVVGDDITDFYDSLDQETSAESVAFTAGENYKTTAEKLTLIQRFPDVFTLQLRRIRFDAEAQVSRKVNTPFHYRPTVFFDRYLLDNKDEILGRRHVNAERRAHIEILLAELRSLQSDGRDGDLVIADTLDLLAKLQEGSSVLDPLRVVQAELQSKIQDVRAKVGVYQETIETAFDDMNGVEYVLHAAVVHEGRTVNMGHYCCYIRVNGEDWYKFNDTDVEPLGDENFVKAIWDHPDKSVYLLFYLRKEVADANARVLGDIPFDLRTQVEADNAEFAVKVDAFIEAEKKAIAAERVQFTQQYVDEWDKLPKMNQRLNDRGFTTTDPPIDPRIESYPFFCWLAGEEEIARYELALKLYRSIVKHNLENPQSEMLGLVRVARPPEDRMKVIAEIRALFMKITSYFTKGIRFLTFTHYELSSPMEAFRIALAYDNLIPDHLVKLRRRPEISRYFGCVLFRILNNANDFLRRDGFQCVEYYQMIIDRAPYLTVDKQFQKYMRFNIVESFFRTVSFAQQYYHRFNQAQCDTLNEIITQFQALNEVESLEQLNEDVESIVPSFGIAEYSKYSDEGLATYHRDTKKSVNTRFYHRVRNYREAGSLTMSGRRPVKKTYARFTGIYKPEKRRVRGW